MIRSLLENGMSLQRVRRAIEYLRKRAGLEEHLSEVKLVTDGKSIYALARNDGDIVDALKEGQMAFFLALDDVAQKVDGKVADYLYDREGFVSAIKRVESRLERELDPAQRRRLRAAVRAV